MPTAKYYSYVHKAEEYEDKASAERDLLKKTKLESAAREYRQRAKEAPAAEQDMKQA